MSKYPASQNNSRSTTIQLPEWNNVHIDMQESQQNNSKQLDWYAPWPWTRIFKTKKQTGSISVVLETGKTQASRKWRSIHQAYKHAINQGEFGNSWSQHVSPIHIWFRLWFHGPFNDVVCITQDPCNHEGTERMTNKVSLLQAPNLEVDMLPNRLPQLSRILLLELDIGIMGFV